MSNFGEGLVGGLNAFGNAYLDEVAARRQQRMNEQELALKRMQVEQAIAEARAAQEQNAQRFLWDKQQHDFLTQPNPNLQWSDMGTIPSEGGPPMSRNWSPQEFQSVFGVRNPGELESILMQREADRKALEESTQRDIGLPGTDIPVNRSEFLRLYPHLLNSQDRAMAIAARGIGINNTPKPPNLGTVNAELDRVGKQVRRRLETYFLSAVQNSPKFKEAMSKSTYGKMAGIQYPLDWKTAITSIPELAPIDELISQISEREKVRIGGRINRGKSYHVNPGRKEYSSDIISALKNWGIEIPTEQRSSQSPTPATTNDKDAMWFKILSE